MASRDSENSEGRRRERRRAPVGNLGIPGQHPQLGGNSEQRRRRLGINSDPSRDELPNECSIVFPRHYLPGTGITGSEYRRRSRFYFPREEIERDLAIYRCEITLSDVGYYPKLMGVPGIIYNHYDPPSKILTPDDLEELNDGSKLAIKQYNQEHCTRYRFQRVFMATVLLVSGLQFFITFKADQSGMISENFQAIVYKPIPFPSPLQVTMVRIKPDTPPPSPDQHVSGVASSSSTLTFYPPPSPDQHVSGVASSSQTFYPPPSPDQHIYGGASSSQNFY